MKIKGQYQPEQTICKWRWSYPVIMVDRGEVRTCDKTPKYQLTEDDFQKYGTDAFINHPYLLERRREKLDGLRHADCANCIILEDRGLMSSRTGEGPFVDWMNEHSGADKQFSDYKFNKDDKLLRSDNPDILEISLSNQCNLKCIYCGDEYSTEWEKENIKFGLKDPEKSHRAFQTKPESFDKFFWEWFDEIKGTLKRIIFIGGEPLVNKNFLFYLEEINKRCPVGKNVYEKPLIQIISNFGVPNEKFEEFLDTLEKLTQNYIVHLEISGESFGRRTEYIRSGAKWEILQKNVHSCLKRGFPNFRFGFQLAINNLCITSLKDLLEWGWALQNQYNVLVDYKENIVVTPPYLSPYILDSSFLPYVDDCISFIEATLANPEVSNFKDTAFGEDSSKRWQAYLPFMYSIRKGIQDESEDLREYKNFFLFTKMIEQRRGMRFLDYFPEYHSFYQKCQSVLG